MNAVSTTQELIAKLLPQALGNIPFHQNTPCINRLVAGECPLHLAIHEVSLVSSPPAEYTQLHVHDDEDEVNIILSNDLLVYKIRLGDDEYCVSNDASIWIPRGMMHAANVLKGSGYFITIKL
jgi:mannose-6-phosphate isomerase-like protein (cupin superfamily)